MTLKNTESSNFTFMLSEIIDTESCPQTFPSVSMSYSQDLILDLRTKINLISISKEEDVNENPCRNKKLSEKKKLNNVQTRENRNELIGIPSVNGFEFVTGEEIIRCEGMDKCTKIIISDGRKLISSYNIGEFEKLLKTYNFFFCHKSHLINLGYIRSYNKEGSIIMTDSSVVPVSRRKKKEFCSKFSHI